METSPTKTGHIVCKNAVKKADQVYGFVRQILYRDQKCHRDRLVQVARGAGWKNGKLRRLLPTGSVQRSQHHQLSRTHQRKCLSLRRLSHVTDRSHRYVPRLLLPQLSITSSGKQCVNFFEELCTADIAGLKEGAATLTVFTNERGGILDDLIVTKVNDHHLYIVSNANRKEQDQKLIMNAFQSFKKLDIDSDINVRFYDPSERSLVALQGPKASQALQEIADVNLSELFFMNSTLATVGGVDGCRITRCGYTGEDGFEISIPSKRVVEVVRTIMQNSAVRLAGLGARDSLRFRQCSIPTKLTLGFQTGSRTVPLRQRHHRAHDADRGHPHLADRQKPKGTRGLPGSQGDSGSD
uniref:Aminomethyltransferase, mitochondrial n=1 Tax=Photinus pyralis TaxID=7054 RepID=A0A1Y1MNZ5_PHOPY